MFPVSDFMWTVYQNAMSLTRSANMLEIQLSVLPEASSPHPFDQVPSSGGRFRARHCDKKDDTVPNEEKRDNPAQDVNGAGKHV